MRVMRMIFLVIIVFLALPDLALGFRGLWLGMAARGEVWSIRHSYFGDAWVLLPEALAIGVAGVAAFRPVRRNWVLFMAAALIALFMSATTGSWYVPPEMRARGANVASMRALQHAVEDWAAERGTYPRTAAELERALRKAGFPLASPFQWQGMPVDYQVVMKADAHDPAVSSERPGALHYAVRLNGLEYWITGTTLEQPVGGNVVMMTEGAPPGPMWVLTGKTQPPAPALRPKQRKK